MGIFKQLSQLSGAGSNSHPRIFVSAGSSGNYPVETHNQLLKNWSTKVVRDLRKSARWFDEGKEQAFIQRKGRTENKLVRSIRVKLGKESGIVEYVGFSFERHGVFVHKGVGRGYEMAGNFVIRTASASSGKPRIAVEWFNPVLDKHLPEIANKLAELDANLVLNTVLARIH